MPNRNYLKGRAFEYRVKKFLEDMGFTVIRASGSHGKYDICAFYRNGNKSLSLLIQCKSMKGKSNVNNVYKNTVVDLILYKDNWKEFILNVIHNK